MPYNFKSNDVTIKKYICHSCLERHHHDLKKLVTVAKKCFCWLFFLLHGHHSSRKFHMIRESPKSYTWMPRGLYSQTPPLRVAAFRPWKKFKNLLLLKIPENKLKNALKNWKIHRGMYQQLKETSKTKLLSKSKTIF